MTSSPESYHLASKYERKLVRRFYQVERYRFSLMGHDQVWFCRSNANGQIIGAAIVSKVTDSEFLHALVVTSEFRKRGVGSRLLAHVQSHTSILVCFAEYHLSAFYQSNQFVKIVPRSLSSQLKSRFLNYKRQQPDLTPFRFVQSE